MDEILLPDEDAIEKLAAEYKKLKTRKPSQQEVTVQCVSKGAVATLKHISKPDSPELSSFAEEIAGLQTELLSTCRGLLNRTYSEETIETLVALITYKRKSADNIKLLIIKEFTESRQPEIPPSMPFKTLAKRIMFKQLKLIKKLNELIEYAHCISTKYLIKEIKEAELLALLHIQAVLL